MKFSLPSPGADQSAPWRILWKLITVCLGAFFRANLCSDFVIILLLLFSFSPDRYNNIAPHFCLPVDTRRIRVARHVESTLQRTTHRFMCIKYLGMYFYCVYYVCWRVYIWVGAGCMSGRRDDTLRTLEVPCPYAPVLKVPPPGVHSAQKLISARCLSFVELICEQTNPATPSLGMN